MVTYIIIIIIYYYYKNVQIKVEVILTQASWNISVFS